MLSAILFAFLSPAFSADAPKPRLAIVIDDLGLNYKTTPPDEEWMRIKWPMTFAVMPESPKTKQAAEHVRASGHELIIHYPFDPFQTLDLAKDAATPHDVASMTKLLDKAFKQIESPKGLNNHRSYKGTMNRPLMAEFMKLYKGRASYFLDSNVSPKTVAYDEAKKAGIPTVKNFIFLEEPRHYNDKAFARRMLRAAAARAKKTGEAVCIGHHYYRGTLEGILEEAPELQKEGIELVYASALAR